MYLLDTFGQESNRYFYFFIQITNIFTTKFSLITFFLIRIFLLYIFFFKPRKLITSTRLFFDYYYCDDDDDFSSLRLTTIADNTRYNITLLTITIIGYYAHKHTPSSYIFIEIGITD